MQELAKRPAEQTQFGELKKTKASPMREKIGRELVARRGCSKVCKPAILRSIILLFVYPFEERLSFPVHATAVVT